MMTRRTYGGGRVLLVFDCWYNSRANKLRRADPALPELNGCP